MNTKTIAIAAAIAGAIALASPASAGSATTTGFQNADLVVNVGHNGGKRFKRFRHGRHFGWHRGYRHGFKHHGYGYRGCGYFYRKAKWTGSRYWWKKYNRCIGGGYHY